MTATRLVTQFDGPRRRELAVATPSCCSCCCCCCGITLATSATLTAVHLNHVGAVSAPARRPLLTVAGALAIPVAIALLFGVGLAPGFAYEVRVGLDVLVVAGLFGFLFYLYRLGGYARPWLPPLIVMGATAIGISLELYLIAVSENLWVEILAIPAAILAGIWLYRQLDARRATGSGRA